MSLRDLFSRTAVLATFCLLFPLPANAGIITWEDGTCVDIWPPGTGGPQDHDRCIEWVGEGFHVTADMPEWIPFGGTADTFASYAFSVRNDRNGDRETHMVFRGDTPFDLLALDVEFGLGDYAPSDGCAWPLELRSSKGGYLLLEPDPGEPDQRCWGFVPGYGVQPWGPYLWDYTNRLVTLSGSEWAGLDWFYIGLAQYPADESGTFERPRPEWFGFTVHSVQVPEPSALLLLGGGLAAAAVVKVRRRRRQA